MLLSEQTFELAKRRLGILKKNHHDLTQNDLQKIIRNDHNIHNNGA